MGMPPDMILLGKIKHKTSPPAPLLIKERGAVRRGEVHLLHLITHAYLQIETLGISPIEYLPIFSPIQLFALRRKLYHFE